MLEMPALAYETFHGAFVSDPFYITNIQISSKRFLVETRASLPRRQEKNFLGRKIATTKMTSPCVSFCATFFPNPSCCGGARLDDNSILSKDKVRTLRSISTEVNEKSIPSVLRKTVLLSLV